jgi:hypothetical protein
MVTLHLVLLILSFLLFALAAMGAPSARVNLVAAGLACWVLTLLV